MNTEELKTAFAVMLKHLIKWCAAERKNKTPDTALAKEAFEIFLERVKIFVTRREEKIWENVRDRAFLNSDIATYRWAKAKLAKVTVQ